MFRDDYKAANESITASDDLKQRTLEKIAVQKQPGMNTYVRYGLVCASFLFVISVFPFLNSGKGIALNSNSGANPPARIPQTGVDESITHDIDNSLLSAYYKKPEETKKELKAKQDELNALKEEKKQMAPSSSVPPVVSEITSSDAVAVLPQSSASSDTATAPEEHIDKKIQDYEKEIKEIEKKLSSEIKMPAKAITQNKITLNEIAQPLTIVSLPDFASDETLQGEDWTQKKISEYLTVSPVPSYVPEDLTWGYPQSDAQTTQKVYTKKADSSIAFATFAYNFIEPQLTREYNPLRRTLEVKAAKSTLPVVECVYMTEESAVSMVADVSMKIGICKIPYQFNEKNEPIMTRDVYVAEFIHNEVGYQLVANNLTQKEFTDVLASVIVPAKTASLK